MKLNILCILILSVTGCIRSPTPVIEEFKLIGAKNGIVMFTDNRGDTIQIKYNNRLFAFSYNELLKQIKNKPSFVFYKIDGYLYPL